MKRSWQKERRQGRSDRLRVVFIRATSCLINGTAERRQLQVWTEIEAGVNFRRLVKKGAWIRGGRADTTTRVGLK